MSYYTGVILGCFWDHENVVLERSTIERASKEAALRDAEWLLANTNFAREDNARADVEVAEG